MLLTDIENQQRLLTNQKLTIKIQIIKLLTILYTANFKLSIQNLKFSDLKDGR